MKKQSLMHSCNVWGSVFLYDILVALYRLVGRMISAPIPLFQHHRTVRLIFAGGSAGVFFKGAVKICRAVKAAF